VAFLSKMLLTTVGDTINEWQATEVDEALVLWCFKGALMGRRRKISITYGNN